MAEKKKYQARCMRCKKQVDVKDPEEVEIKKGTWAVKGKCVVCGTKVYRIIGKKK
ncbi:MAG: hypothetical protein IB618_02240 [Candidatus Pacearchaeota archaeon]|nr:MAG: hypothetical protein IB618_02240 [Candidatus Pacearchaeota archaeon]